VLSGCPAVLADQALDDVGALDRSGYIDRLAGLVQRRSLFPRLVRPMLVVAAARTRSGPAEGAVRCGSAGGPGTRAVAFPHIAPRRSWTTPSTTPGPDDRYRRVRVTHRFHPLFGQDFEFVAHRQNWGEDRVHLHDENGVLFSLPAGVDRCRAR
jgi:hypothetical protein